MHDSVLILAPAEDAHANAVAAVLERDFGATSTIWDVSGFPDGDRLSFRPPADSVVYRGAGSRSRGTQLGSVRSVWWRRVGRFALDPLMTDPEIRRFCTSECEALFKGALAASGVPVVNGVEAERTANHKPVQLSAAVQVGLRIPRTLMSNDADEIRDFHRTLPACIYKAFTAPKLRMAETRRLTTEDLKDLDELRHAPIIVQEMIEKRRDVRVNIFGSSVFAAEVTTHRPEASLDWRLDLTASWSEHALPPDVGARLVELLRTLGLHYGCVDLRQTPDGEYVFFEVNPSGQFLFAEVDTGQPLVRAMAQLLLNPQLQSPAVPRDRGIEDCAQPQARSA
jgi:hypothetical protein